MIAQVALPLRHALHHDMRRTHPTSCCHGRRRVERVLRPVASHESMRFRCFNPGNLHAACIKTALTDKQPRAMMKPATSCGFQVATPGHSVDGLPAVKKIRPSLFSPFTSTSRSTRGLSGFYTQSRTRASSASPFRGRCHVGLDSIRRVMPIDWGRSPRDRSSTDCSVHPSVNRTL